MATLNLKRMQSEKYRAYRILRANSILAPYLGGRVKSYGHARDLLVLPETIFALSQATIYRVSWDGSSPASTYTYGIRAFEKPVLWAGNDLISNIDELLEFEARVTNVADLDRLRIGKPVNVYGEKAVSFYTSTMFANRNAAASYLIKLIEKQFNL